MKGPQITDGNMGPTIGGSKSWFNGRLNLSVSGSYLLSKRNEEGGTIITGSLQGRYNFYKRHALHLTAYYTDNQPGTVTDYYPKYTETRVEAGYGVSF
jgi:hypothetical protein